MGPTLHPRRLPAIPFDALRLGITLSDGNLQHLIEWRGAALA